MSAAPPLIEFSGVSIVRGTHRALEDVTLKIDVGENVAILGPNGSGKSTFIKALTRECYPYDGRVAIYGRETWHVTELRSSLGIVTADLQAFFDDRVSAREAVISGFFTSIGLWTNNRVKPEMERTADRLLALLGVSHVSDRPLTEMSSGEARRVLIARALVHDPKALVLDEPTNSLDPAATREFLNSVRRLTGREKNVVIVTHHLHDIIPEVGRVIALRDGRVVADGKKADVLRPEVLRSVFGVELDVAQKDGWYAAW